MNNEIYYLKETIRKTLGIYKLKFSYLDEILEDSEYNNVYINIDSIIKTLYKLSKIIDDKENYAITISSSIINIVAHYKLYFVKKKQFPKFYLFKSKDNTGALFDNLIDVDNLLKIIFKYVPNVYYIRCSNDIDASIYHFIQNNDNNIILSKSSLDLQLVSPNTQLLWLKRDESLLYNIYNLYDYYCEVENSNIPYQLFSILLSISGVKDVVSGVKKIGKKRGCKLLESYIEMGAMSTHYDNIKDFISDAEISNSSINSILIRNYEQLDTILKYSKFTSSDKKKLDNYIVDKFSFKDIKELNIKYFTGDDSIMLDELMIVDNKNKNNRIVW